MRDRPGMGGKLTPVTPFPGAAKRVLCLRMEGSMMRANETKVEWKADKKQWQVVIQVGAEVIRRPCPKNQKDAADADLRSVAIATARDEGYDVEASQVSIVRPA
jgi:hypothetical protein